MSKYSLDTPIEFSTRHILDQLTSLSLFINRPADRLPNRQDRVDTVHFDPFSTGQPVTTHSFELDRCSIEYLERDTLNEFESIAKVLDSNNKGRDQLRLHQSFTDSGHGHDGTAHAPDRAVLPSKYSSAIDHWLLNPQLGVSERLYLGNVGVTAMVQSGPSEFSPHSDNTERKLLQHMSGRSGSSLSSNLAGLKPSVSTNSSSPPISVVTSYRSIERMDNYSNPPSSVFAESSRGAYASSTAITGDIHVNFNVLHHALQSSSSSSITSYTPTDFGGKSPGFGETSTVFEETDAGASNTVETKQTAVATKTPSRNQSGDPGSSTAGVRNGTKGKTPSYLIKKQRGRRVAGKRNMGLQESFEKCVEKCGASTMQEILDSLLMHEGEDQDGDWWLRGC